MIYFEVDEGIDSKILGTMLSIICSWHGEIFPTNSLFVLYYYAALI